MKSVAAHLVFSGQRRVVDVELILDLFGPDDPLDPDHLLDLEERGLAVLEDECDERTERDPAGALSGDDSRAEG